MTKRTQLLLAITDADKPYNEQKMHSDSDRNIATKQQKSKIKQNKNAEWLTDKIFRLGDEARDERSNGGMSGNDARNAAAVSLETEEALRFSATRQQTDRVAFL